MWCGCAGRRSTACGYPVTLMSPLVPVPLFPEPIWAASAGVGLHLTDPLSTLVAPVQAGHCHGENGLVGNSSSEDSAGSRP